MIIVIEDKFGNDIGNLHIHENNINGCAEILNTNGNISIADIDFDTYYNTNEELIRIQLEK